MEHPEPPDDNQSFSQAEELRKLDPSFDLEADQLRAQANHR
ncbi:MAG TPA: hypothetical protein VMR98_03700 [Candidatus Polarisedimenticolaceae bacterium]|nr:hypothetical protein [Candidatus Polarisedimenticolaceae bacterium]